MFADVVPLQDLVVGLGLVLAFAIAFFGWLILPLLSLILLFTIYIAVRRSALGLGHGLRRVEQRVVDFGRGAARSAATWTLSHVPGPSRRNS